MEALYAAVQNDPVIKKIRDAVKKEQLPIHVWGGSGNIRALISETLSHTDKLTLVVTYDDARADRLYSAFRFYERDVYQFPAKDALFYSADVHGNAVTKKRLEVIKRIQDGQRAVVITTVDGLMDKMPPGDIIAGNVIKLSKDEEINLDEIREKLTTMGYENVSSVEEPGQFSVRGGIIDIFPLTEECPYRVELWGDTIDSIRTFDAESQRSIEEADSCKVYPARDFALDKSRIEKALKKMESEYKPQSEALKKSFKTEAYARLKKNMEYIRESLTEYDSMTGLDDLISYFYDDTVSFLDFFPEDTFIFVDEPEQVAEKARVYAAEVGMSMEGRLAGGFILPGQADVVFDDSFILGRLAGRKTVLFSTLYKKADAFREMTSVDIHSESLISYKNSMDSLTRDIARFRKEGRIVLIASPSVTRAKRIADNLQEFDIPAFFSVDKSRVLEPREVMTTKGTIDEGFILKDSGLVVISESDIFTNERRGSTKKTRYDKGSALKDLSEINVGDYVVHERHGIGIYRGIEKVETDVKLRDYINIEYGDGGKLFIPVEQMEVIGKYASKDAPKPKLNRLGGKEWEKTRSRVNLEVDNMAKELIELYAIRSHTKGHSFGPDTVWQTEFEELFPYDETPDQLRAIQETKKDMESERIMDRLICGDVGFGKTEVAIRAAFKAVQDSKQVAYLVPTTILAQQHYENFVSRFADYPIKVSMLSRFCSPKEIRETLSGLKKGNVDIVIGTHRLLSKDVEFKNLGLLVIDEEQRFGVKHKEKIKEIKKSVDVLTLTATPIPRTLHMSLIGIRDMSLLTEAPAKRRPIQTYVMEYDAEFVKEAIRRELARNGQVYYVYNRVDDIERVTSELSKLMPGVRFTFAHGKMHERELEDIMHDFISGEIDVLVSTTIIETGLDIPNVNTIIVHNADNFGLSQLYQLRGRVGRSSRTAYAFLMYRRDKVIKEVAEKRLSAIREFTELGSGYKISMKDLEIRGAGTLLGKDQSGHMEAVGYDLYVKMLNAAIRKNMGEEVPEEVSVSIDIPIDAHIPDSYIASEAIKLEMYKSISRIANEEDSIEIFEEAKDRFGEPPKDFRRLLRVALLKLDAAAAGLSEIRTRSGELQFVVRPGADIIIENVPKFMKRYKKEAKLMNGKDSGFAFKEPLLLQDEVLEKLDSVIYDIKEILIPKESKIEE